MRQKHSISSTIGSTHFSVGAITIHNCFPRDQTHVSRGFTAPMSSCEIEFNAWIEWNERVR